jgi:hypothetical protein
MDDVDAVERKEIAAILELARSAAPSRARRNDAEPPDGAPGARRAPARGPSIRKGRSCRPTPAKPIKGCSS